MAKETEASRLIPSSLIPRIVQMPTPDLDRHVISGVSIIEVEGVPYLPLTVKQGVRVDFKDGLVADYPAETLRKLAEAGL